MSEETAALLARWAEAELWQPDPEQLRRATAEFRKHDKRRWPGFQASPLMAQPLVAQPPVALPRPEWVPLLLSCYDDFDTFNPLHFGGLCPPARIVFNSRMRSCGGRIYLARRTIELNPWRILQVPESRTETVFHEMIHLWLYVQGLPSGHTPAFKRKMAERGHEHIRFGKGDAPEFQRHRYAGSTRRVIYACPDCAREFQVRRRYGRPMVCAACQRDGLGSHRIVEVGVRYVDTPTDDAGGE